MNDPAGRPVGAMEAALAEALLAALPDPAILIGPDDRLSAANAAAEALMGTGLVGRHFMTALRQPEVLDAVDAVRAGAGRREARYFSEGRTGAATWSAHLAAAQLPAGPAVLVVFRDVTQQEAALQMRRDFVANVGHELKTPLTALSGMIETLQGPARDDPEARAGFLAAMAEEADRMRRLVGDLIALNRVEGEERVRPDSPVDLAGLVDGVLARLSGLAEAAGARLHRRLPDVPVVVPGDAGQLEQLLTNLVENAIRHGGRGVEVTVSLSLPAPAPALRERGVTLTVADTGPGVDPVHLPRLTERFYRADDHRARSQGGTGLGLAIVKHIASRHRGRLRLHGAPGQGLRAEVILPAPA